MIGNEKKLQGQILARFFVKEIDKKKKHFDNREIERKFNEMIKDQGFKVNIYVSIFGIRNLINEAREPKITLKLTGLDEVHTINYE